MHTKILYGAIAAGLAAMIYAFTVNMAVAQAADAKNLKVLPKNMSKKQIKATMKEIAKSLDVQCDYCHDMDDMAKDTEHKEVARAMMLMTNDLNKKHFKGKQRIKCVTCHNGQKEPK